MASVTKLMYASTNDQWACPARPLSQTKSDPNLKFNTHMEATR